MTPLVLKLGGSLAESGRLRTALARAARARRPVVVVPGGGPFADAVRAAQARLGFSDAAAHEMALLAMHQMAAAMVDLAPRLVPADTLAAMRRAWRGRRVPVWLPSRLCAGDRRIPRDWSITSDGLAARLAERLGNADVALVKSCAVPAGASPETLARQGIVDPVFAAIVRRASLAWHVLGPDEERVLAGLLDKEYEGVRGRPASPGRVRGGRAEGAQLKEPRARSAQPALRLHPRRKDSKPCPASSRPS